MSDTEISIDLPTRHCDGRRIRYFDGLWASLSVVREQPTERDIETIEDLYGTNRLAFGATPYEIKLEAMRQVALDFSYIDDGGV